MSKREHRIQDEIQVALSGKDSCVFRTNSGMFYQGKLAYSEEFKQLVLINLRMVKGLPEGFSDLIYVGNNGNFAFIECKTQMGNARKAQERSLNRMTKLGHKAGIARSVEEAERIVKGIK